VQAVGLDLYAQLLEEAVSGLRGETPPVEFDPDINLQVNARLPEDYVQDNHLRLMLYKRLANARDEEDVLAVAEELADRFGPPPAVVENLVEVMRIRTLARICGLTSVELKGDKVQFSVHPQTPLPVGRIIALVSDRDSGFTAPADYRLEYHFDRSERADTVPATRFALQRLAELATEPVDAGAGEGAPVDTRIKV
jgi:transcription-repair coupling factor (superfamily II helicase)